MFEEEGRLDSLHTFDDLYRCLDKGREGSPSYDGAGYQLDYDKVADWKKPKAYNKQKMVRGMDRRLAKAESEQEQMDKLFFVDTPEVAASMSIMLKDYMKDHVSKDLGMPWHQINPEQVKLWRDKGFQPFRYDEWWKAPTEVEKMRMSKMMRGASLRKDL